MQIWEIGIPLTCRLVPRVVEPCRGSAAARWAWWDCSESELLPNRPPRVHTTASCPHGPDEPGRREDAQGHPVHSYHFVFVNWLVIYLKKKKNSTKTVNYWVWTLDFTADSLHYFSFVTLHTLTACYNTTQWMIVSVLTSVCKEHLKEPTTSGLHYWDITSPYGSKAPQCFL